MLKEEGVNGARLHQIYVEWFLDHCIPDRRTLYAVDGRLLEKGNFSGSTTDTRTFIAEELKVKVRDALEYKIILQAC